MAMNLPSGHGGNRRRAPMAEINVTPLVDVMLVLLIIFMITAPLLVAGVPVNLPDSKAAALDQPEEPIVVSVDGEGKVYIDDEETPRATLGDRLSTLAALKRKDGEPQVFLRADSTLNYGVVMGVMGELNNAGLRKVALVTVGENEGK